MSRFDEAADRLDDAVFGFFGDAAEYRPAAGGARPCQMILDQDVETYDPNDVSVVVYRDEAEFLNREGVPVRGDSVVHKGKTWRIGQRLEQSSKTTKVIVQPG